MNERSLPETVLLSIRGRKARKANRDAAQAGRRRPDGGRLLQRPQMHRHRPQVRSRTHRPRHPGNRPGCHRAAGGRQPLRRPRRAARPCPHRTWNRAWCRCRFPETARAMAGAAMCFCSSAARCATCIRSSCRDWSRAARWLPRSTSTKTDAARHCRASRPAAPLALRTGPRRARHHEQRRTKGRRLLLGDLNEWRLGNRSALNTLHATFGSVAAGGSHLPLEPAGAGARPDHGQPARHDLVGGSP